MKGQQLHCLECIASSSSTLGARVASSHTGYLHGPSASYLYVCYAIAGPTTNVRFGMSKRTTRCSWERGKETNGDTLKRETTLIRYTVQKQKEETDGSDCETLEVLFRGDASRPRKERVPRPNKDHDPVAGSNPDGS